MPKLLEKVDGHSLEAYMSKKRRGSMHRAKGVRTYMAKQFRLLSGVAPIESLRRCR
jgi:hypothetical protein